MSQPTAVTNRHPTGMFKIRNCLPPLHSDMSNNNDISTFFCDTQITHRTSQRAAKLLTGDGAGASAIRSVIFRAGPAEKNRLMDQLFHRFIAARDQADPAAVDPVIPIDSMQRGLFAQVIQKWFKLAPWEVGVKVC